MCLAHGKCPNVIDILIMSAAVSDVMQLIATMVEKRVGYGEDVRELSGGIPTSGCDDVDLFFRGASRS